jgi:predicted DNA-binding transcriptional regulator YafY
MELVIRILSFGPKVKVLEPVSFQQLIRERLSKQLELMKQ